MGVGAWGGGFVYTTVFHSLATKAATFQSLRADLVCAAISCVQTSVAANVQDF